MLKGEEKMKIIDNPYVRYPSPWDSYVTLPFSVPLSELLSRTKVTPNQITVFSFLVALFSAWFFTRGAYVDLLVGGILYQISYICDCMDGYIARKNKLSSDLGYWLDHILDELKLLFLVVSLVYGQIKADHLHGTYETTAWVFALIYIYTRVFAKGDMLIKFTIENGKAAHAANKTKRNEDASTANELERPHGMVLTAGQLRMYRKLKIVTPFSVIESQGIAFCLGPIFGMPLTGLCVATVLAICWHGLMDVIRYWKHNALIKA
jgi:phosphatidylglycerophosphate synthase